MKLLPYFIFLIILFFSCESKNQNKRAQTNKTEEKRDNLPNDKFRENILNKIRHEKDRKKLIHFLDLLDERNLSYCDLMKREYEIDDSCYQVANAQYPDPEMTNQIIQLHNDIFDVAHANFAKQIKLTEAQINNITAFYYFNIDVKNFCGKY